MTIVNNELDLNQELDQIFSKWRTFQLSIVIYILFIFQNHFI